MNKQVNATDVGHHFLTKYYNALVHDIDQVLHFFSDASSVKRFGKPAVSGLEAIKTELAKNPLDNMSVRVFNTICLNSLNDSIIIQVSGEFVPKSGEGRAFIQNVVLASQGPGKFYIYSDMIEWLADLYPNLGIQQLSLNEPSHYNGQLNAKEVESRVRQQSDSFADHSQPSVNGQLSHGGYEREQSHGHHGAPVSNIQSFINQAAAAQEQPAKIEREAPQQQQQHAKQPKREVPAVDFNEPEPLQHAQIPEDTGPRTWAKLVSGKIKSNGLPPPTQPPPATIEQLQTMDKKIKTQPDFQPGQPRERREGGDRREGGYKRDGNNFKRGDRDGERRDGNNFKRGDKDGERREGDRPFRRRGNGPPRGEGRDGEQRREGDQQRGERREGGFRRDRQNGGERPFRQQQQQAART
ncbi:hypothetical protein M3Y97_00952800 [Aphelenchoides bicaudatus]|nr:hypothetical protein M3Y97_00952800 [Aphelenchoides bicaudatus]